MVEESIQGERQLPRPVNDVLAAWQVELKAIQKSILELAAIDAIAKPYLLGLDLSLMVAIAKSEQTSSQILTQLSFSSHDKIRQGVAGNLNAPTEVLEFLAADKSKEVRSAVAKNSNAPEAAFNLLGEDPYKRIRDAAERTVRERHHRQDRHQSFETKMAERVTQEIKKPETRLAVARYPDTPSEVLEHLLTDSLQEVRRLVAIHPNSSVSALATLDRDSDPIALAYLSFNPKSDPNRRREFVERATNGIGNLVESDREELIRVVIKDPQISSRILERLLVQLLGFRSSSISRISNLSQLLRQIVRHPQFSGSALLKHLAEMLDRKPSEPLTYDLHSTCKELFAEVFRSKAIDPATLEELASHPHPTVQATIAAHPQTPSGVLDRLAKAEKIDVRANVAANPSTSPATLDSMVESGDSLQRIHPRLGANPNLAPETLWYLAGSSSYPPTQEIAANPSTPVELMYALAHTHEGASVARNPNAPPELLQQLAADPFGKSLKVTRQIRGLNPRFIFGNEPLKTLEAIAQHPNTPLPVLEAIANNENERLRRCLSANPNLPESLVEKLPAIDEEAIHKQPDFPPSRLRKLLEIGDDRTRSSLAAHPNVPQELFEQWVAAPETYVSELKGLARNPAAPPETLAALVAPEIHRVLSDPDSLKIRQNLAYHPNSPRAVLETLARNSRVSQEVLNSPNATPDILAIAQFKSHHQQGVDYYLASRPETPIATLRELLARANVATQWCLLARPGVTLEILEGLSVSTEPDIRWLVAGHPRSPSAVLAVLARDGNVEVREAIANRPDLDETLLKILDKDQSLSVRASIRRYPFGLSLFLTRMSQKQNTLERFLALHHRELPQQIFESAIESSHWCDRYAVTQNPRASQDIWQRLTADENPHVSLAAKLALGLEGTEPDSIASAAPLEEVNSRVQTDETDAPREPTAAPVELEISRSLNLTSEDWLWATWRPRVPRPRPEPRAFDKQAALTRFQETVRQWPDRHFQKTEYFHLDWEEAKISIALSREEAHFWLTAMTCEWPGTSRASYFTRSDLEKVTAYLEEQEFTGTPSFSETIVHLLQDRHETCLQIVFPLHNLFSFVEVIAAVHHFHHLDEPSTLKYVESNFPASYLDRHTRPSHIWSREQSIQALAIELKREVAFFLDRSLLREFKTSVCPYLSEDEIQVMQEQLRPVLSRGSQSQYIYKLAAYLGMHEEVETYLNSCPVQSGNSLHFGQDDRIEIAFGLGSGELVARYARRLGLGLCNSKQVRGWLANTEYSALDWICHSAIEAYKASQREIVETFASTVFAPEVAPYMLELWLVLKTPQLARQWLEEHIGLAIVGLIPIAAEVNVSPIKVKPKELVKAAVDFLCSLKRKGYETSIRAALERESPDVVAKIEAEVLKSDEREGTPFTEETTPDWWREGLLALGSKQRQQKLAWVSAADLPSLTVGDFRLSDRQIEDCLRALQLSTLESPLTLVEQLKLNADRQSLDRFIWSLFERWQIEGGSAKEKWAMAALGLLGSDEIALKLTSLIRKWPGESRHARAVLGLECLRAIGSDTALMQLHGISQKVKYKGLKERAKECLEDIARDRRLSRDELADRIIPDCDLDSRGSCIFDFGSRQFHFVLSGDLKPHVRDPNGKLRTNLPKPTSKDDPEKAKTAAAEWKLLKKQVTEVANIQSVRLEQAMVGDRRWSRSDFETFLATHPLMTHVVQRLVWMGYDSAGFPVATFRVVEDRTYAGADDEALELAGIIHIGLPHPLRLQEDTRAAWRNILSDYEIVAPFPQIGREIYTLAPEEKEAREIKRFEHRLVEGVRLARTMMSLGWNRGALHDHGDYSVHYKYFPSANLTAIAGDYENQHVQSSGDGESDAIDGCVFLVGHHSEPYDYPAPDSPFPRKHYGDLLPLKEVDAIVISEVLRDLTQVVNSGEST